MKKEISVVLMLYSRLVSSNIFLTFPTLNIHPSLLLAFKGINAVGQALDLGFKFIGATLHVATEKVDDGCIVAQVVSPLKPNVSKELLNKLSFLQKPYLILTMMDCIKQDLVQFTTNTLVFNCAKEIQSSCSANPSIQSKDIREMFSDYQKSIGMDGVIQ